MTKRREKATARQPLTSEGLPLTPDQQALFRLMNDETASKVARCRAAMILTPIMHKPLPVRYVTAAEAQRLLDEALRK